MKTKLRNNERIWPEWDAELNRFGEWLLVGCIASAPLPPGPGLVAIVAIVYVGLTKAEPKAEKLFSERKKLMGKEEAESITPAETHRLDRLLGELRRTQKRRDTRIYVISWITMILTLCYICHKFSSLPLCQWFF